MEDQLEFTSRCNPGSCFIAVAMYSFVDINIRLYTYTLQGHFSVKSDDKGAFSQL